MWVNSIKYKSLESIVYLWCVFELLKRQIMIRRCARHRETNWDLLEWRSFVERKWTMALPCNPKIYIKSFILWLKFVLIPIIIMVGPFLKFKIWRPSSVTDLLQWYPPRITHKRLLNLLLVKLRVLFLILWSSSTNSNS
jgi:hypothetical protein